MVLLTYLTVSKYMKIQAQGIVSNTPVVPLDGTYNSTLLSLDRPSIYLTALLKEEKRGKEMEQRKCNCHHLVVFPVPEEVN